MISYIEHKLNSDYEVYEECRSDFLAGKCLALIELLIHISSEEIAKKCSEEGYPSNGSNYELRVENEWDWYRDQYPALWDD